MWVALSHEALVVKSPVKRSEIIFSVRPDQKRAAFVHMLEIFTTLVPGTSSMSYYAILVYEPLLGSGKFRVL